MGQARVETWSQCQRFELDNASEVLAGHESWRVTIERFETSEYLLILLSFRQ